MHEMIHINITRSFACTGPRGAAVRKIGAGGKEATTKEERHKDKLLS